MKQSPNPELERYRRQFRDRLKSIAPIFARASIGDFSTDVPVLKDKTDDDLTEFFVGVQIILDAIREKMAENEATLARLNAAHDAAEHEKAIYRAILSSVGEGLVVIDKDTRITLINQAAADMLMIDRTAVVGSNYFDVVVTRDRDDRIVPLEKRPLKQAVTNGKRRITTLNDGLQYIRSDGSTFPVAITASPVKLGKDIIGGVSTFRDISVEKQLDHAKSEIISLASHQLRTPLTAIKWISEELVTNDSTLTTTKRKHYLQQIYSSNQRMLTLITDLMNVSRLELGKLPFEPEAFNLHKLVGEITKDLSALLRRKKIRLDKRVSDHLKTVETDPRFLRIIIQNLLTNAVKYSPKGKDVLLSIQPRGHELHIVVRDHGYGIPLGQQNRIFGKLFRADNARRADTDGTGLGLYLSKAMVEQAGGKIWFESVEAKGTTFYVTIPLSVQPSPSPAHA